MAQKKTLILALLFSVASTFAQSPTRVDLAFYAGTLLDSTYIDTTNKGVKVNCIVGCETQYAEDTAHVSGDQLTFAGVVQQAADAALSNDLDRSLLQVDATGYLKVNVKTIGTVTVTDGAGAMNVIVDSGTTTVTQATATNLNAAVVGTGTAGTPAGNILTVQGVASMTKLLVTPDSVALPANQSVNTAQINGVAPTMGNGISGTGVQRVTVASDSTGQIALAAGSATIGALTANQSVNTAQINAVTPLMGNGISGTGAQRVTIASDSTGQIALAAGAATIGALTANQSINLAQIAGTASVSGGVAGSQSIGGTAATDAAVNQNPVLIGCRAEDTTDAAAGLVVSAEGDLVPCSATRSGAIRVIQGASPGWSYHENSSSALTDATVHASCGTGLFNYIGTIAFSSGAATQLTLLIEDGTTTTILGPWYLEAVNGRGAVIQFVPAKKQTTSATLISVTTTGAVAHSIDITGWCSE